MSGGFIPAGYMSIAVHVRRAGIEPVGRALAAGHVAAFAYESDGNLTPIPIIFWRGSGARRCLESGQYFVNLRGGEPHNPRPILVRAPKTPAHPANVGRPAPHWWPTESETLTAWAMRQEVVAEADRRIKAAGGNISEGLRGAHLEDMWVEAGQTVAEGSIVRLRRRKATH